MPGPLHQNHSGSGWVSHTQKSALSNQGQGAFRRHTLKVADRQFRHALGFQGRGHQERLGRGGK